ncbi:MAG: hypothetical protein KGM43_19710 [Planctomycetota bacterium]|nr:hypothetical protein [Planctomycetota bacterium]
MPQPPSNKFRAAMEVLARGRDVLIESIADEVVDQGDNFAEGGFLFHEFLEMQGARLHFLGLLMGQLEQSAETLDESRNTEARPPVFDPEFEVDYEPDQIIEPEPRPEPTRRKSTHRRRARSRKLPRPASSAEGPADEA